MVTKKQKKIIQDIKKTSKELKKKGISSREVILIMTSILILAVAVMGFTVLGNEINELSIESDRRIRLIERLNNLIKKKDAKLNKLKNENLKLKGEIEDFKNELEKLNKKANDLEVINEHLEVSNKHWYDSLRSVGDKLTDIHSELTLMTNKKISLERKNKQLEKTFIVFKNEIDFLLKENMELERTIKNFPFLWSTYLDDLTKDLHGYTNLKKRHLKLKKRTKKSIKYHQDIAKKRQEENKRPWLP